jgi:hypothetical protein
MNELTPLSMEERIAALEREVADLKAQRPQESAKKDWRRTIGMFTDNPGAQEIFTDAMKLREAERVKVRRRQPAK